MCNLALHLVCGTQSMRLQHEPQRSARRGDSGDLAPPSKSTAKIHRFHPQIHQNDHRNLIHTPEPFLPPKSPSGFAPHFLRIEASRSTLCLSTEAAAPATVPGRDVEHQIEAAPRKSAESRVRWFEQREDQYPATQAYKAQILQMAQVGKPRSYAEVASSQSKSDLPAPPGSLPSSRRGGRLRFRFPCSVAVFRGDEAPASILGRPRILQLHGPSRSPRPLLRKQQRDLSGAMHSIQAGIKPGMASSAVWHKGNHELLHNFLEESSHPWQLVRGKRW
jgi:hypothetical protein